MYAAIEVNDLHKRYGRAVALDAAAKLLGRAGATMSATGRDTLTISGVTSERAVALLGEAGVPFPGVSAPRATLEGAYLRLIRDAVEFRAATVEEATR
jgi:ABC-2 type transport system ATP-binding protein